MPRTVAPVRPEEDALKTFSLISMTERLDPRHSWNGYLVATGLMLAILVAALDPAVSRGIGLWWRVVYWALHFGLGLFLLQTAHWLLCRLRWFGDLQPLPQILLSGTLGSLAFVLVSLPMETVLILPGLENAPDDLSFLSFQRELRDLGGIVLLAWLLVNMPRLFIIARQGDEDEPTEVELPHLPSVPAVPDASLVELLSRLPRQLGHDIAAVSAEAHYLRVYTAAGEALVLMSFGRAVDALAVVRGQVIHRSHWVAYAAIDRVESRGDACFCVLDTGLVFPVSRTHRQSLRAALAEREQNVAVKAARLVALREAEAV